MKKIGKTRDLLALGFIAPRGLRTLFVIPGMSLPTGQFVYAGTAVLLSQQEACNIASTQCSAGLAEIVSTISGSGFNQHPGQYTACICPEDVFNRDEKGIPQVFDTSKLRLVRNIQQYNEAMNLGQE